MAEQFDVFDFSGNVWAAGCEGGDG